MVVITDVNWRIGKDLLRVLPYYSKGPNRIWLVKFKSLRPVLQSKGTSGINTPLTVYDLF